MASNGMGTFVGEGVGDKGKGSLWGAEEGQSISNLPLAMQRMRQTKRQGGNGGGFVIGGVGVAFQPRVGVGPGVDCGAGVGVAGWASAGPRGGGGVGRGVGLGSASELASGR